MVYKRNCIFCLKTINDDNSSIEHVLPDALGGSLVLNRYCCCRKCNSSMGSELDAKLIDLFSSNLMLWNIRSSKNKDKEPVQKVFIQVDEKTRIPAVLKHKQWVKVAHITKLSENRWVFPSEQAKKEFLSNNLRKGKHIEFEQGSRIPTSNITFKLPVLSEYHFRAFVKIAYNVATYVLGAEKITKKNFDIIRSYINLGLGEGQIYYPDPQANYSPIKMEGPAPYETAYMPHYLALCSTKDRRLLAMINIFGFNYVVVLSDNWSQKTDWLSYLYHADRYIKEISKEDFHKYLDTSY